MRACAECGRLLPPARGRGRPRIYCTDRCRWRVAQRRRRSFVLPTPLPDPAPGVVQRHIAEDLAGLLSAEGSGSPEDEIVNAVLELQTLAARMGVAQKRLPARLALRAGLLRAGIVRALREAFGGESP